MGSATTMSQIDKKQLVKLVSFMSTFDGGLYRVKQNNAQFIMNMREENSDYIHWVKDTLEEITSTRIYNRKDYNVDGYSRQPQLRLESNCHPFLTTIQERIYIDNHKVIDPHMLTLLDAEALAIIFMADGGTYLDTRFKTPYRSIKLHTKGFSYGDNWLLKKAIKKKLGLEFNINKHYKYFFLSLRSKDIDKFIELISPFILPSFQYKLERLTLEKGDDIV
jgi:hypothetical protein